MTFTGLDQEESEAEEEDEDEIKANGTNGRGTYCSLVTVMEFHREVQMGQTKTAAYYISPIEIGLL